MVAAMGGEFRFVFYPSDYERSVEFYRDRLGLRVTGGWDRAPGDRGVLFEAAGGIIEILEGPGDPHAPHESGPPQGGWIAIEVDNVDHAYEQANARGLPIDEGLEDKPWGHRSFAVRDPDGLLVVLFRITW
jgi:catechol 2,3-dioxygenase-like lactoylglutathione lyase family enzyme